MSVIDEYYAEMERESREEVAKYTRVLRLAEMNGIRPEIIKFDGRDWWRVPPDWVPIAGAMMVAVNLT